MKALLTLAILTLAGCSSAPQSTYDVEISPRFTWQLAETILESLSDWQSKTPVVFHVRISECTGSSGSFCIVPGVCPSSADSYEEGCTSADMSTVTIEPRSYELGLVVRHEIGHAMGLVHDRRGTVMCATVDCAQDHVTPTDAAQWERIR